MFKTSLVSFLMPPLTASRSFIRWSPGLKSNSPPGRSIGKWLTVLVLAALLPVLGIALLLQSELDTARRQAVRDGLMTNARTLAALVDNEIDTHLAIASAIATFQALELADPVVFQSQVKQALVQVPDSWISVFDTRGMLIQSTTADVRQPQPARGARDVMERAWRTKTPQLSNVVFGPITRRHVAFLEYPVFKDGNPLYSIVIGLNPLRFRALIENKFGNAIVGILDRDRNFVARSLDHEKRVGTPASTPWQTAISRSSEGFLEDRVLEGTQTLTAYVTTREGWTVGIAQPQSVINQPIEQARSQMLLAGLVFLALGLFISFNLAHSLNRSLVGLATDALILGQGKTVDASSHPIREAALIGEALREASIEQRAAREHQRMLMEEINHRSKNLLALVQAVARQTATKSPEVFLERFNQRLQAIAQSQDLMIRTEWRDIPLTQLLRNQLAHVSDDQSHVIELSGSDIALNASAAEALGMAVHELATNAAKYGALSTETGRVGVTWSVDAGRFSIKWAEAGGPIVIQPERRGFGWTVLCQMTKLKLEADVTLDYDPTGLIWRLQCPIDRVIQGRNQNLL